MTEFNGFLTKPELLDLSQGYEVKRPSIKVDSLFPDRKTQNLQAEYMTISADGLYPTMALVHAMDTEAEIGNRPAVDHIMLEKMLIKRKINLTERMKFLKDHSGVPDSAVCIWRCRPACGRSYTPYKSYESGTADKGETQHPRK